MLLQKGLHEPLLKEDLQCWRCHETFKTLPKLKKHLEWEKEAEASREEKDRQEKERKNEGYIDGEPSSKRPAITPSGNA